MLKMCSFTAAFIFLTVSKYDSLWYVSPKSHNLRLYQQDIYEWNRDQIATKMSDLEFKFQVVPGNQSETNLNFMTKPMSYEKDEIKLRERFFYEQAYFLKTQALINQNIPAVYWVEDMVQSIKEEAANVTRTDLASIYSGEQMCLNI